MRIGLAGAQGVGKSTLAEAVSNETDLPLIFTKTSDVFKDMGLRPDQDLGFDTRIEVQNEVLNRAEDLWSDHVSFITDRTPLDMLAYTLIDINSDTRMNVRQEAEFFAYEHRCYESLNRHFTNVTLVQPGIQAGFQQNKSRASLDKCLVSTMNTILLGLLVDSRVAIYKSMIPAYILDLGERVEAIDMAVNKSALRFMQGLEECSVH